jgi:hypothetical protein
MPARALGPWALDSGAFSELSMFGRWTVTAQTYAREVRVYSQEIGGLEWAAIQDFMCEPFILAKTGKSVREHQLLTVRSLLSLRSLAPDLPWVPVLQGWLPEDYLHHREMYARAGVDLLKEPVVGIGSVCRRGITAEVYELARRLSDLKLHGFGLKIRAAELAARYFKSTDSMAWSFRARHASPLPGCHHPRCVNCLRFALRWRRKLIQKLEDARVRTPATAPR